MTETEMVRRAQARALEAIAEVAARRTAERARLQGMCETVILERLARGTVVGTTKTGRLIVEMTGTASTTERALRAATA